MYRWTNRTTEEANRIYLATISITLEHPATQKIVCSNSVIYRRDNLHVPL